MSVDLVCSEIMGFDHRRIPLFKYALKTGKRLLFNCEPEKIEIAGDKCEGLRDVYAVYGENFIPARGWAGHIERDRR